MRPTRPRPPEFGDLGTGATDVRAEYGPGSNFRAPPLRPSLQERLPGFSLGLAITAAGGVFAALSIRAIGLFAIFGAIICFGIGANVSRVLTRRRVRRDRMRPTAAKSATTSPKGYSPLS